MKTSISLIGFMGTGKSSAGKLLAERLGKSFIEADSSIEQKASKPIPRIFQEDGEIAFRELEIEVIKEIAAHKNQVVSCGGGAVLNRINIDRLKKDSVIVWLKASPSAIARRTGLDGETRPLLGDLRGIADIRQLLQSRRPFYESAADIVINNTKLSIEDTVSRILEQLKENADYNS